MAARFGDMLYTRSSWGSKEIAAHFGFNNLSKSVCGVDEAGEELIAYMLTVKPYISLQNAIRAMLVIHTSVSPTFNLTTLKSELMKIWNAYSSELEDVPNEYQYLKDILSHIEEDFNGVPSVGRKKLRSSIIKHCLNLYVSY